MITPSRFRYTSRLAAVAARCGALALLLLPTAAPAQRKPTAGPVPIYAPVKDEIELGRVRRGQIARFEWSIRNKGRAPLRIQVKATCNCTVPMYDRVIAPGKTGKVAAELTTLDLSGYTTKTLLITTNDPKRPKAGLYMTLTVVSMVEVLPSDRVVMRVGDGSESKQELTLRLAKGETAEITAARSNLRYIQPKLEPIETGAGSDQRAYRLTLTAAPDMPNGRHHARITLATTSSAEPEVRIFVTCEKGIVTTPERLYLGTLPVGKAGAVERPVQVTSHGRGFGIRSVTCEDPNVRVSYSTIRTGEYYRVTVRYLGGWSAGWVQRQIVIETDDPVQPRIVVPLSARVGAGP